MKRGKIEVTDPGCGSAPPKGTGPANLWTTTPVVDNSPHPVAAGGGGCPQLRGSGPLGRRTAAPWTVSRSAEIRTEGTYGARRSFGLHPRVRTPARHQGER